MLRRREAALGVVTTFAASLSVGCGADRVPDLDINGIWSINWIETRYPKSNIDGYYPDLYGDYDLEWYPGVEFHTLYFEIEGLETSHEGGGSDAVDIWSVSHGCPLGWSAGATSTITWSYPGGGYGRWLPDHPNTLLHEVGWEEEVRQRPMYCTFPSTDQMRCMWGMPFEPAIRPEERDEVLVFDRGDAASAPVPCERVAERALIGPHLE